MVPVASRDRMLVRPDMTPRTNLEIRSLITTDGRLKLWLEEEPVAEPGPDEVIVRIEAAPINPSDLGLLLAGSDVGLAKVSGIGQPDGGHGADCTRGDARALRSGCQ